MNPLKHVAIIMDGNGRWGLKNKNSRNAGHKAGLKTVEKVIKETIKNRVKYLTLYAFSTENWKRPKKEITYLFDLLENFLKNKIEELHKQNIKLKIIGNKNFAKKLNKLLISSEKKTFKNTKLQINLALNYGSKFELINAFKSLKKSRDKITEKNLSNHLQTKGIPDPDLLIRTGDTKRLSNFLLWQLAYSEIFFEKRILSSLILIPVSFFFIIKGSFFFDFFLIICLAITLHEWHMMSKKKKHYPFGILFLILSFYTAYLFREASLWTFLFIIIICISTDIGGYILGKLLKGPKLTKISPNKTYSGLIGGYIFSIIFINIFLNYSYLLNLKNIEFDMMIFIIVILVSSFSQVGDIIISYFKRLSKIKDTGKIIPGHGGILDRVDGMIFAFPFSYLIYLLEILK